MTWGSAVALRHKTGGSRFDYWQGPWKFSSDLFCMHAFSSLAVHSAHNKNENQGISLGVKCGRRVELTTVPSWFCGISKYGWKPNIESTL
jgi:hypothetical protein